MTNETGTLVELGAQPGDVVEWMKSGVMHKIGYIIDGRYYDDDLNTTDEEYLLADYPYWRIISRANQPDAATVDDRVGCCQRAFTNESHGIIEGASWGDAAPKTFGEMTDAEKGALLLAAHEGKVIEFSADGVAPWKPIYWEFDWIAEYAYRIKPEPEKETLTLYGGPDDQLSPPWRHSMSGPYSITIPMEDGQPIPAVYRSEAGDELIVGEV